MLTHVHTQVYWVQVTGPSPINAAFAHYPYITLLHIEDSQRTRTVGEQNTQNTYMHMY